VGLEVLKKVGEPVERGEPVCRVHEGARSESREAITARIQRAWRIGAAAPAPGPLVLERMA
jgi:pyrimidine-nucleoside phosphorylase/thymidine phosphorylase